MEKQHHSLSDWDFLYRSDWSPFHRYDLFTSIYVSPPSCLRFELWATDHEQFALSNLPEAHNLPAGRITTWHRAQSGGVGNSYIYIGVTGPGNTGIPLVIQKITGDWWRTRIDWWQGFDELNNPATLVLKSDWVDGEWSAPSLYSYPPMTGAINRIGIGCTGQSLGNDKYFDDTEIWLPI